MNTPVTTTNVAIGEMSTQQQLLMGFNVAAQYAALAAGIAAPFLTPAQTAVAQLAFKAMTIVAQSIQDQSDIDSVTFEELSAREVLILAEDARVQAEAEAEVASRLAQGGAPKVG